VRILLSAYSCGPHVGSEPGVGWNWSVLLAQRHDVVVLTSEEFRPFIETELSLRPRPRLHFVFLEIPLTRHISYAAYPKYILWQLAAFPLALRLHRKWRFDVVQHLTMGTFRYPSWLGFLGIPFVFGPVGGGERAPIRLYQGLPLRVRLRERLRTAVMFSGFLDPFFRIALSRADVYVAKTKQSMEVVPASVRRKAVVHLEIGANPEEIILKPRERVAGEPLRALMVCRLIGWKGIHFAIDAARQFLSQGVKVEIEVCGAGSLLPWLQGEVQSHGLQEHFRFLGAVSRNEVKEKYRQADLLLFPSLHDSSGNAVIEALGYGLPVICLDLGGPAEIVTEGCGIVLPTCGRSRADVGNALAEEVAALERNESLRQRLALGAIARAHELLWSNQVSAVEALLENVVKRRLSK
jgi:glycosyltransferase involved in cell wall biosynthesis